MKINIRNSDNLRNNTEVLKFELVPGDIVAVEATFDADMKQPKIR